MSPSAKSVSAAGCTLTALTSWATVTAAVPDADPAVAVIVAVPLPTAVTRPPASTVATDASPLNHVTATPAIARPAWSRTSADNWTVAPSADRVVAAGVTVTEAGVGGGGGGGGGPGPEESSPQERIPSTPNPNAIAGHRGKRLARGPCGFIAASDGGVRNPVRPLRGPVSLRPGDPRAVENTVDDVSE